MTDYTLGREVHVDRAGRMIFELEAWPPTAERVDHRVRIAPDPMIAVLEEEVVKGNQYATTQAERIRVQDMLIDTFETRLKAQAEALGELEAKVTEIPTLCRRYEKRIDELEADNRQLLHLLDGSCVQLRATNKAQAEALEAVLGLEVFVYVHEDTSGEMHTHRAFPEEDVLKAAEMKS
jgi:hypothetical protein